MFPDQFKKMPNVRREFLEIVKADFIGTTQHIGGNRYKKVPAALPEQVILILEMSIKGGPINSGPVGDVADGNSRIPPLAH